MTLLEGALMENQKQSRSCPWVVSPLPNPPPCSKS